MKTRCWVWVGQINAKRGGYGVFNGRRRPEWAHRAAWEFKHGPVPKGKFVLHRCDHPPCVRHLFVGEHRDNMKDARRKDRTAHGIRQHSAKLTDQKVVRVRSLLRDGRTHKAIARLFKVGRRAIGDIANGVTWRRVK